MEYWDINLDLNCPNNNAFEVEVIERKKALKIKETILQLLSEKAEVGIHDVAEALGLSKSNETDRKAIRRAFTALIKKGVLRAEGAARARVYLKATIAPTPDTATTNLPTEEEAGFKNIALSTEARILLKYVSQPLQARTPVGYNQNFLHAYRPNKTFYLNTEQRQMLHEVGRVETQTRPAGTYARNIMNRLLVDLSWNSSRLEGNTYSLLETKRLIELGEAANGKEASEAQMILNHKAAIEYIVEASSEDIISSHEVCSVHALLSENLLGDPSASGRVRQIAVGIAGTTYLPIDNPHTLREYFDLFVGTINRINDPFEQSFFALVHLSYMQAFEDINKRTARLVANVSLIKSNLKPLSFMDVDQSAYVNALLGVYEKNDVSLLRDLYLWAYTRSSQKYSALQQSMGEPNLLKLKYRLQIQEIIRAIIIEKTEGYLVVSKIKNLLESQTLPKEDKVELFKVIETEIMSLHDGNIARFKIRPSEFEAWKDRQSR